MLIFLCPITAARLKDSVPRERISAYGGENSMHGNRASAPLFIHPQLLIPGIKQFVIGGFHFSRKE